MRFINKNTGTFLDVSMPDLIKFMLRSDSYIAIKDAEHWITLHGGGEEGEGGSRVLINGEGEVVGGAGGKLNGKTLDNVQSKSKDVEKPKEPAPAPAPTPTPNPVAAPAAIKKPEEPTEKLERPAIAAARQATNKARDFLKSSGIDAKVKFDKDNLITSISVPTFESRWNEDQQKKIQSWAIENGYTYVQNTPIDPNQYVSEKMQYNLYHNPSNQKPHVAPSPAPIEEPKKEQSMQEKWAAERAKQEGLSTQHLEQSVNAKTMVEHMESMNSNMASYKYWKGKDRDKANAHAKAYNEHLKQVKVLNKQEKKSSGSEPEQKTKEAKFTNHQVSEINAHMEDKYGLGFVNGSSSKKETDEIYGSYLKARAKNEEGWENIYDEYQNLVRSARSHPSFRVAGHTSYDINTQAPGAKAVRKMLGHVDSAMESLESSGFDVKGALSKANVKYISGTTGKHNGHSWQDKGVGYFSISVSKRLGNDPEQAALAEMRKMKGEPRWSISSEAKDQARATIVHELTHALGLQQHLNSPTKLNAILDSMNLGDYKSKSDWIKTNISEYASKNIRETDAELAAMVTAPDYVRGTLPKQLEDHVDWLFMRKQ